MFLNFTAKSLPALFQSERERVATCLTGYPAECAASLADYLEAPGTWNYFRDFTAQFASEIEPVLERIPTALRGALEQYLFEHQSEPVSRILGLKVGWELAERCDRYRRKLADDTAAARLAEQLLLTTDETLCQALSKATGDDLTVLLKVLPVERAGLLTTRVPEPLLEQAVAQLDKPLHNTTAIVETWLQRL